MCIIGLLVAGEAQAAVVINEVAWMGTSANANAEWIELHNTDTSPVDLTGWTLTASGGSPSISLNGTIAADGFYLLERTSDATVPGISAGTIYTGALANTGLTLTLKDGGGTTMDTVVGGTNWSSIGGDNDTKQTPQRAGTSWVTADPTPGAVNTTTSGSSAQATTTVASTAATALVSPVPRLGIESAGDRTLATKAASSFEALVYDHQGRVHSNARIHWSFGDGSERQGADVEHAYREPGEYVVSIRGRSQRAYIEKLLTITVKDAHVALAPAFEKGIALTNLDDRLLDLSRWELVSGGGMYVLPEGTYVLPERTIIFSPQVTRLATSTGEALLRYPGGEVATFYGPPATSTPAAGPVLMPPGALLEAKPLADRGGIKEVKALAVTSEPAYADGMIAPTVTHRVAVGAPLPPLSVTLKGALAPLFP